MKKNQKKDLHSAILVYTVCRRTRVSREVIEPLRRQCAAAFFVFRIDGLCGGTRWLSHTIGEGRES